MEGKKRVKTTEYNPSLCSRDNSLLVGADAAKDVHWGHQGAGWLDVNVKELLQTLDVRPLGARGSSVREVAKNRKFLHTRQSP